MLKETAFAHQLYSKMVGIADKDWCDIQDSVSGDAHPTDNYSRTGRKNMTIKLEGLVQSIRRI